MKTTRGNDDDAAADHDYDDNKDDMQLESRRRRRRRRQQHQHQQRLMVMNDSVSSLESDSVTKYSTMAPTMVFTERPRPDSEAPDSPIKSLPCRKPVLDGFPNGRGSGSYGQPLPPLTSTKMTEGLSSTQFSRPPRFPQHQDVSETNTHLADTIATGMCTTPHRPPRGILKKQRPNRSPAFLRPPQNGSVGSSASSTMSMVSSSNLSLGASSSHHVRNRRSRLGNGSMHQPFVSINKKRVTFWDEQSVGTALSLSLHRLCDRSASPSPRRRFQSIGSDNEDDEDGCGYDDFDFYGFEDDYESDLDEHEQDDDDGDYDEDERNPSCRRQSGLREVVLPCVKSLDVEDDGGDDSDRGESTFPTEIKWDQDTTGGITCFCRFGVDENPDLPTPSVSNQQHLLQHSDQSSANNVHRVPRYQDESSFIFMTPSGEKAATHTASLHTDMMPIIPKSLSIPLPDLEDDEETGNDNENVKKGSKEQRGFAEDVRSSTSSPSDSTEKINITTKESPTSVVVLNSDMHNETSNGSHDQDDQAHLCSRRLAKAEICHEAYVSLPCDQDNRHLSPMIRKRASCNSPCNVSPVNMTVCPRR